MAELLVDLPKVFAIVDAPDDDSVASTLQVPEESLRYEMDEANDIDAAGDFTSSVAASFSNPCNHLLRSAGHMSREETLSVEWTHPQTST
jgi:hypothetical protein